MGKLITLISCNDIPEPISEDQLLMKNLNSLGFTTQFLPWQRLNDPHDLHGAVLIRTTWDYTQHLDQFLRTLRKIERAGVPLFNPLPLVEWNATKTYLRDLEMEGISIPLTFWYDQINEVDPGMLWPSGSPAKAWVLKPQVSASARGTFLLRSAQDYPAHRSAYEQGG